MADFLQNVTITVNLTVAETSTTASKQSIAECAKCTEGMITNGVLGGVPFITSAAIVLCFCCNRKGFTSMLVKIKIFEFAMALLGSGMTLSSLTNLLINCWSIKPETCPIGYGWVGMAVFSALSLGIITFLTINLNHTKDIAQKEFELTKNEDTAKQKCETAEKHYQKIIDADSIEEAERINIDLAETMNEYNRIKTEIDRLRTALNKSDETELLSSHSDIIQLPKKASEEITRKKREFELTKNEDTAKQKCETAETHYKKIIDTVSIEEAERINIDLAETMNEYNRIKTEIDRLRTALNKSDETELLSSHSDIIQLPKKASEEITRKKREFELTKNEDTAKRKCETAETHYKKIIDTVSIEEAERINIDLAETMNEYNRIETEIDRLRTALNKSDETELLSSHSDIIQLPKKASEEITRKKREKELKGNVSKAEEYRKYAEDLYQQICNESLIQEAQNSQSQLYQTVDQFKRVHNKIEEIESLLGKIHEDQKYTYTIDLPNKAEKEIEKKRQVSELEHNIKKAKETREHGRKLYQKIIGAGSIQEAEYTYSNLNQTIDQYNKTKIEIKNIQTSLKKDINFKQINEVADQWLHHSTVNLPYKAQKEIERKRQETKLHDNITKAEESSKRAEELYVQVVQESSVEEAKRIYEKLNQKVEEYKSAHTIMDKLKKSLNKPTRTSEEEKQYDYILIDLPKKAKMEIKKKKQEISIDILKPWMDEEETFCETRATDYIYNEVVTKRNVIVSGLPGSGKSANLHHIALRLKREGHRLCSASGVKEVMEKVGIFDKEDKQVYVIDDVFGVHYVAKEKREEWTGHDVKRRLNNVNVKILCSSRTQVTIEIFSNITLKSALDYFSVAQISDEKFQLTNQERSDIFRKHASAKHRNDLLSKEVTEKIRDIVCPADCFLLACRLYTDNEEINRSIEEYFSKPLEVINDRLKNLRNKDTLGYFCLLLCLIYSNKLPKNKINVGDESEESKELREDLLESCLELRSIPRPTIRMKMETLVQTFVKLENDTYHFINNFIYEAIIEHINNLPLPSDVHGVILRHCSFKFVQYKFHLGEDKCKNSKLSIKIKRDVSRIWGERMLQRIYDGISMSNQLYRDISEGKCDVVDHRVYDDNPWRDVFCYNRSVCTEEGDKIIGEALKNKALSEILDLMCTEGYRLYRIPPRLTALHFAVEFELKHIVSQTLSCISQTKLREIDSIYSLLHVACRNVGNTSVIEKLIEGGLDVNAENEDGCTPLWVTVGNNDYKAAKLLLEYAADVNKANRNGCAPLSKSVCFNDCRTTAILLNYGADVNKADESGCTPLLQSVCLKDYKTTKMLLEHGADVNKADRDGRMPLLRSVRFEDYETTKLLLKYGADINKVDNDGYTPLLRSVCFEDYKTTEMLLKCGADVNEADKDGCTPLLKSVCFNAYKPTAMLLKYGADVNTSDKNGCTPLLKSVVYFKDCQTTQMLLKYGAEVTPLLKSIMENDYQLREMFPEISKTTEDC